MTITKAETARRIKDLENWPKIIRFPESETFNPDKAVNCISLENLAVMLDTSIEHLIAMLDKIGRNEDFPDIMIELETVETKRLTNVITFGQSRRIPGAVALSYTGRSEPINGISFRADFEIEISGYSRDLSKPKKGA